MNSFRDEGRPEHPLNGVQTGLDDSQLIEILRKYAEGWREHDRLDVLLLRAICQLSLEQPQQSGVGFASSEIVDMVGKLRASPWVDDPNAMSDAVRKHWNKLLDTWMGKEVGIHQRFADEGAHRIPVLRKNEGGGTGRPSRYRIEWLDLGEVGADQLPPESNALPSVNHGLKYVCEDLDNPGFLAGLFVQGYRLMGWRRWVMLLVIFTPMLFIFLVLAVIFIGLSAEHDMEQLFRTLIVILVFGWITVTTVGPLLNVVTRKIVLAPWWMQSDYDDRLLELHYPPRHPHKSIKAVKYSAKCPVCGGAVSVQAGGLEFWGRLIGRCEHAPKEHIYSFDHVTRRGRSLRDWD